MTFAGSQLAYLVSDRTARANLGSLLNYVAALTVLVPWLEEHGRLKPAYPDLPIGLNVVLVFVGMAPCCTAIFPGAAADRQLLDRPGLPEMQVFACD